jgi:putative Ca2+/H+ antiporter (TMEM165/GDT1 family)
LLLKICASLSSFTPVAIVFSWVLLLYKMYKAFNVFVTRFLTLSEYFLSAVYVKAKASNNTVKQTAKIISLQHYIAFSSIDVINREEDKNDIQREAIIISFS